MPCIDIRMLDYKGISEFEHTCKGIWVTVANTETALYVVLVGLRRFEGAYFGEVLFNDTYTILKSVYMPKG